MDSPSEQVRARTVATLALGVALLVLARGALVASLADVFGYGEELQKAAAAKALLDGLDVPHRALAFHPYEGGGFLVSHLEALAFALVGPSLLALKLVALSWTALILLAGMGLALRLGGRGAALAFAGLFVLAPPPFQKLSLLALGIHFEALLFLALALRLLLAAAVDRDERPRTWALLGLVCGLGTWYSLQCLLASVYAAGVLVLTRRRVTLGRAGLAGATGFVVGLAPLYYMAAYAGSAVLDIHGESLVDPGSLLERVGRVGDFLRAVLTGREPLELLGALAWLLAPAAALAWLCGPRQPRELRARAALIGGYLLFFLAAYVASGFAVGTPYHWFLFARLAPALLAAALLVSAAAARAMSCGGALARAGWGLTLALLLTGGAAGLVEEVAGARPATWRENLRVAARTSGYYYVGWLWRIGDDLPGSLGERARVLTGFREPHPERLRFALGAGLIGPRAQSLDEALQIARASCGEDWRDVALGLGQLLRREVGGGRHEPDELELLAALEQVPDALLRERLTESLGRLGLGFFETEVRLRTSIERALELELPPAWVRGLGWRAHLVRVLGTPTVWHVGRARPFLLDHASAETFLQATDERARADLLAGWRAAMAERTLP